MAEDHSNNQVEYQFTVSAAEHGARLDVTLAQRLTNYSRSRLQAWIKQGLVLIDGAPCKPRVLLACNQVIDINAPDMIITRAKPQAIPLDIIHEDDALMVINKPAGLIVHPGAGNPDNTLLNALLYYHPALEQLPRAGIIHRLDKDTSGLLVIPKTLTSHHALSQQLQSRQMARHYLALVKGNFVAGATIDAPIGRHHIHRTRMAVTDSGKPAITHYRIHERFGHYTLLKLMLETGRTHQIRVHCQHIKHPIIGDPVYGKRPAFAKNGHPDLLRCLQTFKRQALHAYRLELVHPQDQKSYHWTSPLPDDLDTLITTVRKHDPYECTDT